MVPEIVDLVAIKKNKEAVEKQIGGSQARTGGILGGKVYKKNKTERFCQVRKNHSEKTTVTEKSLRFIFQSG